MHLILNYYLYFIKFIINAPQIENIIYIKSEILFYKIFVLKKSHADNHELI